MSERATQTNTTGFVHTQQTAKRGRVGMVVLLIVGLLIATGGRQWAMGLQKKAYLEGPYAPVAGGGSEGTAQTGGPSLGSLDSYFLILMLGGLRGPLVMFLWSSSENQKNERDLEDFDTKVEMIRLLQPEFDSVHLFQMWNKAYNVSAQVPSLPNKYAIILDAIEYGKNVDRARPNNLNILLQLNQIYQHKLGSTAGDSVYYRRQVREDSKWRGEKSNDTTGVGALDRRMPALLDKDGKLLPELVTPAPGNVRPPSPARVVLPARRVEVVKAASLKAGVALPADQLNVPSGARELILTIPEADAAKLEPFLKDNVDVRFLYVDWNNGSDLQYLQKYEPFPYGVSPLPLGYNYGKRAQVLMNRTGQRPAQGSQSVVDSRAGHELRDWGIEESERATNAEARAFGLPLGKTRGDILQSTADLPVASKTTKDADVQEALYSFELAARLSRDSRAEFTRHINNPIEGIRRMQDYAAQLDNLEADELLYRGDLLYLRAVLAKDDAERASLLQQALQAYQMAVTRYQLLDLRFYIPGEAAQKFFPPGLTRDNLKDIVDDPARVNQLYGTVMLGLTKMPGVDQNQEERSENSYFIRRAVVRASHISKALGIENAPPATQQSASSN